MNIYSEIRRLHTRQKNAALAEGQCSERDCTASILCMVCITVPEGQSLDIPRGIPSSQLTNHEVAWVACDLAIPLDCPTPT